MDDQHSNDTAAPASGSGFFSGAKGWIAGITGVITAMTGLVVACDKFVGSDTTDAKPAQVAALAKPAQPQLYVGKQADGTSVTLTRKGDGWELVDNSGTYQYEELKSSDDTRIVTRWGDYYLRWPPKGGMAEEGKPVADTDKKSWEDYADISPAQPAKP